MDAVLSAYKMPEIRKGQLAFAKGQAPEMQRGIEQARRTYIAAERTVDKHGGDENAGKKHQPL